MKLVPSLWNVDMHVRICNDARIFLAILIRISQGKFNAPVRLPMQRSGDFCALSTLIYFLKRYIRICFFENGLFHPTHKARIIKIMNICIQLWKDGSDNNYAVAWREIALSLPWLIDTRPWAQPFSSLPDALSSGPLSNFIVIPVSKSRSLKVFDHCSRLIMKKKK